MDRNLVLAFVLTLAIIVGFQLVFQTFSPSPPPGPKVPPTNEISKDTQQLPTQPQKQKEPAPAPGKPADIPTINRVVRPLPDAAGPPAKDERIRIDGPKYEAIISSVGGRIVSFRLKNYKVSIESPEMVNLFEPDGPDTAGPAIVLTTRDDTFSDVGLAYHLDSQETSVTLNEKELKKSITLKAKTSTGLNIVKTFTFHADTYLVDFSFTLTSESGEDRNYLVTFPWSKVYRGEGVDRFAWNSAEILLNNELKDYFFKDIKGDEEPSGRVEWAGLGDVYFFKALVFGKHPAVKVTLVKPAKDGIAEILVRHGALDLPAGQPVETRLGIYLGPKERDALEDAGSDLSRALFYSNYKILDVMSEYLMKFLRFCNSGFKIAGITIPGTHNYGVDIIILTFLIKILFIPLTHKSMKSMKRMQELQPQIAKIKEKHKDDKAAINKGTMELFRDQKVNPLGSCWPMFLQIPVFIALYQALSYAIELRHAHFLCFPSIYLCLNDLSAPDPFYVTPILMGGTMVLQQWMTPSAGDPTQKKMMLMMPVVFTYMFLSFPSGLVLYWLVSNVLSIGQQVITNKMSH
ncbi:MAG: membrane protein insertase YidC [Deltaproteobacteria bacterium]|nr:membrane protein insertase YidC [Deltaproteobacteria bacterium]